MEYFFFAQTELASARIDTWEEGWMDGGGVSDMDQLKT